MNTHQGFWTILIKHCRIYDLPNLPAEYNSVCRVWICSGKICRARLSKTKGYLCDFVNVHHSPPPPPTPSIYDWHRINNGPYFWGTNHPCTINSKRWPSWLLRLSAPIWYFAIFPLAFKPIHADIKKWLYAIDCQMPAQISEYSGKYLPICHKPTLNCCSKSALNWWERYYLHFPAYIWQNCS